MNILVFLCGLFALLFSIARYSVSFRTLAFASATFLFIFTLAGGFSFVWGAIVWVMYLLPTIFLGLSEIRQKFISIPLLKQIKSIVPPMSDTERDAIEAGSVWWEAELFRGAPDWGKLLHYKIPLLSDEERAFLDGPVEQLCTMIDDWDITHNRMDLPEEMWDFLKQQGFFGMIIPKKYGGLEFSAYGHSCVVMKLSARSISVGVTVMVPNSLGPAELLLHYGSDAQKKYYLPRLADGREIPCFALTGPDAGSDAGSIPDTGVVCKGDFEGKQVLGLRLNWEKRNSGFHSEYIVRNFIIDQVGEYPLDYEKVMNDNYYFSILKRLDYNLNRKINRVGRTLETVDNVIKLLEQEMKP